MSIEVSEAKREVIRMLTDRDWTPTDLAEELGKSTSTTYNHLEDLARTGVLEKRQVDGKTRPRTEYSLGEGFVQYVAAMPAGYDERSLRLDWSKRAILRIWSVPQPEFQPYVEELWFRIKRHDSVEAFALYGSVARGDAEMESDIDVLLIAADEDGRETLSEELGTMILRTVDAPKIATTTVYTVEEYRDSLDAGSDFLRNIQDELHVVSDPGGVL